VGAAYLHWFHGVNPMGKVMLTNMYAYGGDSCVNEFYHSWFNNGTVWDNVFTSAIGPAPGYLIGGPNKDFSIPAMSPPGGQPPQKSYKEWNTGWNGTANENSWEITEAGIYTQAAYISLLVRVMANNFSIALPLHILSFSASRTPDGGTVQWEVTQPDEIASFELQRSTDGSNFTTINTIPAAPSKTTYTVYDHSAEAKNNEVYYRVKEITKQGRPYLSSIVKLALKQQASINVYPNPVTDYLTINGYTASDDKLSVSIFDAEGKSLRKEQWHQMRGNYSKTIAVNDLPAGMYSVQVAGKETSHRIKIIK
jgi:hypothetical protein